MDIFEQFVKDLALTVLNAKPGDLRADINASITDLKFHAAKWAAGVLSRNQNEFLHMEHELLEAAGLECGRCECENCLSIGTK